MEIIVRLANWIIDPYLIIRRTTVPLLCNRRVSRRVSNDFFVENESETRDLAVLRSTAPAVQRCRFNAFENERESENTRILDTGCRSEVTAIQRRSIEPVINDRRSRRDRASGREPIDRQAGRGRCSTSHEI